MTGANSGEWLDGRPSTMPRASSIVATPANRAGSEPPRNQYTHGTPAAVASRPTSSLPVTGPGSSVSMPASLNRPASLVLASLSLTRTGNETSVMISGSLVAPEAAASPRTMRSIAARALSCTFR